MKAVSFNVLADAYLDYGDYSHVSPDLLRKGARINKIIDLLSRINPDVAGLQEVDATLAAALHDNDRWQVFYTPKGNDKPDGCATLVSTSIAVDAFTSYEYSDPSGHVAQYIKLGGIAILNTHLKWAPPSTEGHPGVRQAEELMNLIDLEQAVLFADCNNQPGGPVRRVIEESGFINVVDETPTAIVNGKLHALDLLSIRSLTGRSTTPTYDISDIPNVDCPSDHIPLEAEIDMRDL